MKIMPTGFSLLLFPALTALVAVTSTPALAAGTIGTSAYGVAGNINSAGSSVTIAPVGPLQAGGPKPFTHNALVPLFSESVGIASGSNYIGSVAIVTSGIANHLSSSGIAAIPAQAEADTAISSVQVTVALPPPSAPSDPVPPPLLALTATNVAARASESKSSPFVPQQDGTASFGSLTLSGTMLNGQNLTFQGSAPANTVLYSDANMIVTLNEQTLTGVMNCVPQCNFVPEKMVTSAVHIQLFNKPVVGKVAVSGNLEIAQVAVSVP